MPRQLELPPQPRGVLMPELPFEDADGFAEAISTDDPLRRAELEARILADQPAGDIAAAMGLAPEAVIQFEEHCFDVRCRLNIPSWIVQQAIRLNPEGILNNADISQLWKWTGYSFGLEQLERLLNAVHRDTVRRDGVDAYLRPSVPLDLDFKILIAIQRLPIPKTPRELLRMQRILEAQKLTQRPAELVHLIAVCREDLWTSQEPSVPPNQIGFDGQTCWVLPRALIEPVPDRLAQLHAA